MLEIYALVNGKEAIWESWFRFCFCFVAFLSDVR